MNWSLFNRIAQHVTHKDYTIVKSHRGEYSILCHKCGRISYHPEDVKQLYCGHCHIFHDDEKGQQ